MKSLAKFIQEKLVIKKNSHNYFPETKKELQDIIDKRIREEGNEVDFNDIDVSKITNMSHLFEGTKFNGDISSWDVSNVKDMSFMFWECPKFNSDISEWDVSNVTDMHSMFYECIKFNQDISKWDVSNVTNMHSMFWKCKKFNQDLSNWDVSKVKDCVAAFYKCKINNKYIPKFKQSS